MRPNKGGGDYGEGSLESGVCRVDVACAQRYRSFDCVMDRMKPAIEELHFVLDAMAPVEAQISQNVEGHQLKEKGPKGESRPVHSHKGAHDEGRGDAPKESIRTAHGHEGAVASPELFAQVRDLIVGFPYVIQARSGGVSYARHQRWDHAGTVSVP